MATQSRGHGTQAILQHADWHQIRSSSPHRKSIAKAASLTPANGENHVHSQEYS
jgi:hypothetical protein